MEDAKYLLVVPVRIPPELIVLIGAMILIVVAAPILLRLLNSIFSPVQRKSQGLFELNPYLLTKGEHAFLRALEQAVNGRFRIAMKVRLGDLVYVRGNDSNAVTARNRIFQKHVDFVLCDEYPVKTRLVVELDDASHDRPDRQRRDSIVDECLECAGLPILHVRCRRAYDVAQIATDIEALIGREY
jgi:hypothetical protein